MDVALAGGGGGGGGALAFPVEQGGAEGQVAVAGGGGEEGLAFAQGDEQQIGGAGLVSEHAFAVDPGGVIAGVVGIDAEVRCCFWLLSSASCQLYFQPYGDLAACDYKAHGFIKSASIQETNAHLGSVGHSPLRYSHGLQKFESAWTPRRDSRAHFSSHQ